MGLPLAYYGIDFPSSLTCRVVTANFWSQEEKPHRRAYSSKGMVTVIPPRLPPPRARGRALRLAVPAGGRGVGGWVGGWMDSRSGPRSAGQRVPLVRPQRSRAVGASLAGQQAGAVSLLQGEVWVGRRGQFWSRGITRGSGESLALLAGLLHPRTCRLHRTL